MSIHGLAKSQDAMGTCCYEPMNSLADSPLWSNPSSMLLHAYLSESVFAQHLSQANDWLQNVEFTSLPLHCSKPARNHHYHSPCFTTPREELLAVSDVLFDSHLGFDGSKDDFFLESAWHPMEFSSEKFACSQRHCDAVTSVRSSSSQNTSTFNRSRLGFCYYDGEFDKNVQSSDSSKFSGKEFLNQDLSVASEMGASGNVCKAVGKINSDKPEEEIYFGSNGGKKENLEKGRASNEAQYVNIPEEVLTEEDANDFKSCTDNEECHGDGLALSQKTIEDEDDEEDGRDDGRKSIASEEQNASPMVPSCQLMMLESYVLQLLRVPNSKKKDVMSFDDGR